ncbi:MAG: GtrA family protein [Methanobrevibacter sp.]|jgi:putative flippase GtrA|nr:GtrA family protein [Candidatus Methanovirga aequatorialis]
MIGKILSLLKNEEVILYLIFGVLTTFVNFISFYILNELFNTSDLIPNVAWFLPNTGAWFLSVVFAYVTNKIWVFESKNKKIHIEFSFFVGGRIFSYVVESCLMYLLINILCFNYYVAKIISQIIGVVLNYVLSKGVVFK